MIDSNAINLVLLVLRVTAATVMLAHGINHIFGGGKIAGTGRWFESLGMKPGLAPRVAGQSHRSGRRGVVGARAAHAVGCGRHRRGHGRCLDHRHRGNGFFIFRPGEGWEYVMTLTVVGLALGTLGPGTGRSTMRSASTSTTSVRRDC